MARAFFIVALTLSASMLSGCVTQIAPNLPTNALPEITVASEVPLVVSPSAPASYLPIDAISAGATLQVLGRDEDSAWLLVLHDQHIGWVPSVFSRTNIARLQPALTVELPTDDCTEYLGAVTDLEEPWVSPLEGDIRVLGSIYRQGDASEFADATLAIQSGGSGSVLEADYLHIPVTGDSTLVLFTYLLLGVQAGETVVFDLDESSDGDIHFQAAFLADFCSAFLPLLPIGQLRIPEHNDALPRNAALEDQTPGDVPEEPAASIEVLSGNGTGSFYDEFDSPALEAGWFWLNEDPDEWSLDVAPGYLRIMTDEGDMAEGCRNQRNILLREGPSGDFSIQTKVLINPDQNYQQGGLIIHDDPDNYVKLDLLWSDDIVGNKSNSVVGIELLSEENAKFAEWPWPMDILRPNETGVLLKLTKSGNWYDGYYSVDGHQWSRVGSLKVAALADSKIGLFALTGVKLPDCNPTASQIPVDFDYFYVDAQVSVHAPLGAQSSMKMCHLDAQSAIFKSVSIVEPPQVLP